MMMIRKIVRRNKDKLDTSRARTSKIDGRNHMRHKCMPHNIGSPPNLLQYALFPSQKKNPTLFGFVQEEMVALVYLLKLYYCT